MYSKDDKVSIFFGFLFVCLFGYVAWWAYTTWLADWPAEAFLYVIICMKVLGAAAK